MIHAVERKICLIWIKLIKLSVRTKPTNNNTRKRQVAAEKNNFAVWKERWHHRVHHEAKSWSTSSDIRIKSHCELLLRWRQIILHPLTTLISLNGSKLNLRENEPTDLKNNKKIVFSKWNFRNENRSAIIMKRRNAKCFHDRCEVSSTLVDNRSRVQRNQWFMHSQVPVLQLLIAIETSIQR